MSALTESLEAPPRVVRLREMIRRAAAEYPSESAAALARRVHGASAPLVADVLGVAELERRAGAPTRPGSMLTKRGVVERFRAGRSPVQIAAEADVSVGRVETILRNRGLLAPRPAARRPDTDPSRPADPRRGGDRAVRSARVAPDGDRATRAGSGAVVEVVRRAADQADGAGDAVGSPFACRGHAGGITAVHTVIAHRSVPETADAVDLLLALDALHREAIARRDATPSQHLAMLYAARARVVEAALGAGDRAVGPA